MKGFALLLLALLTGGSSSDLRLAERIQALLSEQMGEIDHLSVRVARRSRAQEVVGALDEAVVELSGFDASQLPIKSLLPYPKERALKGRVGRLLLDGRRARVEEFTFSRLSLEVTDLRVDLMGMALNHQVRITGFGGSRLEAAMAEEELVGFVAQKLPLGEEVAVDFRPGQVVVTARVALGPLELPLTLTTGLKIVAGHRLELDEPRIESGGFALPGDMVQRALGALSPLMDLHRLLGADSPLQLDRVEVTDREMVLLGHLEFGAQEAAGGKEEHYARLHARRGSLGGSRRWR